MKALIVIISIVFLSALVYFCRIQSREAEILQIELRSAALSVKLRGVPIDDVFFSDGHFSFDLVSEAKSKVWMMRSHTFLRNGDDYIEGTKQGWNRISDDDTRDFRWLSQDRRGDLIYSYRNDKVIGFIVYSNTMSADAWVVNKNNDGILIKFSDLSSVNDIELVLKGIEFNTSKIDLEGNWN
jgi:hypothetical protein